MVNVTLVLPDGRRGPLEVDPTASIEEVKKTIVSDLGLGDPKNFRLAFSYQTEDQLTGESYLHEDDVIFLMESIEARKERPAKLDPDVFKKR